MTSKRFASIAFISMIAILLLFPVTGCDGSDIGQGSVIELNADSCKYNDNLSSTAQEFISRCRKGSINREFPKEYNNTSLRAIKNDNSAAGRKAYKLLNNGRFKK